MEYNVISPDGFPISPENFSLKFSALRYYVNWRDSLMKVQGFYSTVQHGQRVRLYKNDLKSYCYLQNYKELN